MAAVIVHKKAKFSELLASLPSDASDDDIVKAFQAKFPKEWDRICVHYAEQHGKKRSGKGAMPNPRTYVLNGWKVAANEANHPRP